MLYKAQHSKKDIQIFRKTNKKPQDAGLRLT